MRHISFLLALIVTFAIGAQEVISLNGTDWRFSLTDVNSSATDLDDSGSGWTAVKLPHTWNALDGQDGGDNYRRGKGWYRKLVKIPAKAAGKTVYMDFGAANMVTELYVNGKKAGEHTGGYARFMFDITCLIKPGEENLMAVMVDNSSDIISPPLSADFTFYGGITRGARLVIENPVHINPLQTVMNAHLSKPISVASPGVKVEQTSVTDRKADVSVTTRLRNTTGRVARPVVSTVIRDAKGRIVLSRETELNMPGEEGEVKEMFEIENPHLWNGKADPYRYVVEVTVMADGRKVDSSRQPLGLRYFHVDKNKGFFLNGKPYPLRGLCIHDEKKDKGRAVSDADRKADLDLMLETGANFLRLAHYQHGDFTYGYLDSLGIVCWTEVPVIDKLCDEAGVVVYEQNAASQLYELIHQLRNHPSVCFWGVCNEIRNKRVGADPRGTVRKLVTIVREEDPTRLSTLAANFEAEENSYPDTYSLNRYNGWYGNNMNEFATDMDYFLRKSTNPVGVSEYGAGANTAHHELPAAQPKTTGQWHPEECQNAFHECYIKAINERPFLWETSVWAGIDFACDERNEGDQPGINDKGLVTHDRRTRKDAYYLYKAEWNKNDAVLYITSRRYARRPSTTVPVKVYSNCPEVTLKVNGKTIGTKTVTDNIAQWPEVTMKKGRNKIEVKGKFGGRTVTDRVEWECGVE